MVTADTLPAPSDRHALATTFSVCNAVLVTLVLTQAAIAGQFLFQGADIALHGYVGNASFVLGVVTAVLSFVSRSPGWLRILAVLLVLLLFSQTGLGYVGRNSGFAASWHIPLGVATFGVAVATLTGSLVNRQT